MKKVLVFGITDKPGGVESVIMNYYRNIDRNNIQFDFLCNTETIAYEDEIKSLGGKIYKITARSQNRIRYKKDMCNFFEAHSSEYESIWVNVCSLANIDYLKYAKKYGIKKRIIHAHNSQNMDSFLRGILHRINKKIVARYATNFWSCSNDSSKWFYNKKIEKSSKYLIIKNAIDLKRFMYNDEIRKSYREKLKIEDKIVFGNVGRFHFQKNQLFLIRVFEKIQKEIENSVLVLVGDGEDSAKIKNLIEELKISDKVLLLGFRNDVENVMQAMDVFIFPSVFEGLGIVAIEAQACGLPVYASNKVIPEDVNIDKQLLKFIDLNNNENEWAKIIIEDLKKSQPRRSNIELFQKAGYDIKIEARKVEEELC